MDVVSSVGAIAGLVFNFAAVIKACNDLRGRYKDADRTIECIRHELETLHGALEELLNLMMHDASALTSRWDASKSLPRTFERAVKGFERSIRGLQEDIEPLRTNSRLGRMDKFRLIWNDDAMKEHLGQLRAQSGALQLLLQVLQTGSISVINSNLNSVEAVLAKLAISPSKNGDIWDHELPAHRHDTAKPSHILDLEDDLMDLDWSVSTPADDTAPSPQTDSIATGNMNASSMPPSEHIGDISVEMKEEINNRTVARENILPSDASIKPITRTSETMPLLRHSSSPNEISLPPSKPLASSVNQDNTATESSSPEQRSHNSASNGTSGYNPRTSIPPLVRAVFHGDIGEVKSLIDAGDDLEIRHPFTKRTAAIIAAQLGDSTILEILLDAGASFAASDVLDRTALHYAASEGWIDCVKLLIFRGASIDCRDADGDTPLLFAFRSFAKEDVLEIMLAQVPDPLKLRDVEGKTILHMAAQWKRGAIQLILDKCLVSAHQQDCPKVTGQQSDPLSRCDCLLYPGIDAEDHMGHTALQTPLFRGDCAVVSAILDYSPPSAINCPRPRFVCSSVDLTAPGGVPWERSLHLATRGGNIELLKLLTAKGAKLELLDSEEQSPLQLAIHTKNKDATFILLRAGASLTTVCTRHKQSTLLDEVVEEFSSAILDDVVESLPGLDICTSTDARAVLKKAQIGNRWKAVRKLVSQCTQKGQLGRILDEEETLFHMLWTATADDIRFLVANGASVNTASSFDHKAQEEIEDWRLPIHVVAGYERLEIVEVLLQSGASILSKAGNGWLPLHPAVRYGGVATVRYFLERTLLSFNRTPRGMIGISEMARRAVKIACKRGSVEIVQYLLESTDENFTHLYREALYTAIQYGRREVTEYLVKYCHFSSASLKGARDVTFEKLEDEWERPGNKVQDYEACRALLVPDSRSRRRL